MEKLLQETIFFVGGVKMRRGLPKPLPKSKKATPGVVAMHIAAAATAPAKPVPQVKPAPAKAKAKAKKTTSLQQYLTGGGGRGGSSSSSKSAAKSSSKSAAKRPSFRPQHELRGQYAELLAADTRAVAVEKSITL